mmetsp:Transcript_70215/g.199217  ORF Transcript_70215/g.199217 Transcript_70215/m.199217 type:complete len:210 (-) Transcript_70215:107-736(-)
MPSSDCLKKSLLGSKKTSLKPRKTTRTVPYVLLSSDFAFQFSAAASLSDFAFVPSSFTLATRAWWTCWCRYTSGRGCGCSCLPFAVRSKTSISASGWHQKMSPASAEITARVRKPIAFDSFSSAWSSSLPSAWCSQARAVASSSAKASPTYACGAAAAESSSAPSGSGSTAGAKAAMKCFAASIVKTFLGSKTSSGIVATALRSGPYML